MAYKDPAKNAEKKRDYYERNREKYRETSRLQKQRKREHLARLKNVPCMDCGKKYPYYVMDFDHRENKQGKIADMVANTSWARLLTEIAKCDIVCANCHRIRSFSRGQYGNTI